MNTTKNENAVALGKLSAGVKRVISPEVREQRRARMSAISKGRASELNELRALKARLMLEHPEVL